MVFPVRMVVVGHLMACMVEAEGVEVGAEVVGVVGEGSGEEEEVEDEGVEDVVVVVDTEEEVEDLIDSGEFKLADIVCK